MPSGRTHDRITLWCLPFIVGLGGYLTRSPALTVTASLAFLVGGLMLGPDLDIHSIQYKRWGPVRWIWLPYQMAIKHRSKLSHGPIIGTMLRVLYLSVWLVLFTFIGIELLNLLWDAKLTWQSLRTPFNYLLTTYLAEWVAILVGLELGAISHSVSDVVGSYWGKQRRKKKRRQQKQRKSR